MHSPHFVTDHSAHTERASVFLPPPLSEGSCLAHCKRLCGISYTKSHNNTGTDQNPVAKVVAEQLLCSFPATSCNGAGDWEQFCKHYRDLSSCLLVTLTYTACCLSRIHFCRHPSMYSWNVAFNLLGQGSNFEGVFFYFAEYQVNCLHCLRYCHSSLFGLHSCA